MWLVRKRTVKISTLINVVVVVTLKKKKNRGSEKTK